MTDTEKILKEIYLPLNRIIMDLLTLGDMSIVQYLRKMADEIESSGHTSESPLYVSLNRKINTLIDRELAEERLRLRAEIEKYYSMEEVVVNGQRFLKDENDNTLPFGYPYPDTKEKYIIKALD